MQCSKCSSYSCPRQRNNDNERTSCNNNNNNDDSSPIDIYKHNRATTNYYNCRTDNYCCAYNN